MARRRRRSGYARVAIGLRSAPGAKRHRRILGHHGTHPRWSGPAGRSARRARTSPRDRARAGRAQQSSDPAPRWPRAAGPARQAGRAVGSLSEDRPDEPPPRSARRAQPCAGRSGRRGRPVRLSCPPRSSRRRARGRRPCHRSCTRSRAGRSPRRRPRRRSCGPRTASRPDRRVQPAAGRPVQTGVPGDRLAAGCGSRSGSGATDRAARQPLGDIVVGLTGESQLDAGPGERPERLASGAAKLETDRAVNSPRSSAPGEPAPNDRSAVVTRSPDAETEPWPRNAVAMPISSADAGARPRSRPPERGCPRVWPAPHDPVASNCLDESF